MTLGGKFITLNAFAIKVERWGFPGGTVHGTWVRALLREDPTCRRATKPMRHNY